MKYTRRALLGLAAVTNAQGLVPGGPPPPGPPPGPPGPPPPLPYCPTGPVVIPTAVVYPLYISTYIAANTVFNINGGANITINNAPTNLQTTVTATSTVFSTVTTTVSGGTAPTATTVNGPIVLAINVPGVKNRRQNAYSGYLGPNGNVVPTCGQASQLSLINGQLFTTAGGQFSTSPGIQSAPFAPNAAIGPITTLFGSNGNFVWQNSAFTGGAATFCLTSGGQAIAGFTSTPAGCSPITFKAILASSCPGGTTSGTSSGTSSGTASGTSSSAPTGSSGSSSAPSGSPSVSPTGSPSVSPTGSPSVSPSGTGAPTAPTNAPAGPTGQPPAGGTPVQVTFPPVGMKSKDKRQGSTNYLTNAGTYTTDQSQAGNFSLVNGELYSGGTPFSTNPTVSNMIFTAVQPIGQIVTQFSLGPFKWQNSAFTINSGGTAQFAVLNGYLYASFKNLPPGAQAVAISAQTISPTTSSSPTPTPTPTGNSTVRKRFNAYHLQAQHLQEV